MKIILYLYLNSNISLIIVCTITRLVKGFFFNLNKLLLYNLLSRFNYLIIFIMEGGCIVCGNVATQWCFPCRLPICAKHSDNHSKRFVRLHIIHRNSIKSKPESLKPTLKEKISKELRKALVQLGHLQGNHIRYGHEHSVQYLLENNCKFFFQSNHDKVVRLALSNKCSFIVTLSYANTFKIWDFRTKKQIMSVDHNLEGFVLCMTITNDSKYIIIGSNLGKLSILNTKDSTAEDLEGHTHAVNSVVLTSDEKYIVSCSGDKTIRIWSLQAKTLESTLTDQEYPAECIIMSKDDKYIISGSFEIIIWNFQTQIQEGSLKVSDYRRVKSLAVTSDNQYIVCSCKDSTIRIFNFSERKLEATLQGHTQPVLIVGLSSNGKYAISYSQDRTVRLWSMERLCQESVLTKLASRYEKCIAITDNNEYVITGRSSYTIEVYNFMEKKNKMIFEGHPQSISSMAITSDYRYIITGSHDKTVRIWDFHQRNQVAVLKGHKKTVTCLGVTSDAKFILSYSCEKLIVWAFKNLQESQNERASIVIGRLNVRSLSMTDNRKYIAAIACSAGEKKHIHVWKTQFR